MNEAETGLSLILSRPIMTTFLLPSFPTRSFLFYIGNKLRIINWGRFKIWSQLSK